MKISVIVPVYHTAQYLNTCVASILRQTYEDYELILVDDASADACVTMCDDWASRDPRIRVIHKPINVGLAAARNTGVLAAQGDYVCYVDSDDELSPYYLELLLLNAERFHADVTYCHYTKNRSELLENQPEVLTDTAGVLADEIHDGRASTRARHDLSGQTPTGENCDAVELVENDANVLRRDIAGGRALPRDRRDASAQDVTGATDELEHTGELVDEINAGGASPRLRHDLIGQNAIPHTTAELWELLAGVGAGAQGTTFIVAWNKLIRTEIARQITFPKGRWHEDEYYVNQLLGAAHTYVEIPEPLYYYRQRGDSIMAERNRIDPRHMDIIDAFEERVRICREDDALYRKMLTGYRWTIYIQYHTFGTGMCALRLRWRILMSLVRYPAPGLKGTRNALLFAANPRAFYHKNWHESAADN